MTITEEDLVYIDQRIADQVAEALDNEPRLADTGTMHVRLDLIVNELAAMRTESASQLAKLDERTEQLSIRMTSFENTMDTRLTSFENTMDTRLTSLEGRMETRMLNVENTVRDRYNIVALLVVAATVVGLISTLVGFALLR